jgi:hypothetical protein
MAKYQERTDAGLAQCNTYVPYHLKIDAMAVLKARGLRYTEWFKGQLRQLIEDYQREQMQEQQ